MKHGYIVALMLGALATQNLSADITKGWNDATDPLTVGKRVAQRFVEVPHPNFDANPAPTREITYPETCAWLGALRFAAATGDEALTRKLEERLIPIFGSERHLQPMPDHVDHTALCHERQ